MSRIAASLSWLFGSAALMLVLGGALLAVRPVLAQAPAPSAQCAGCNTGSMILGVDGTIVNTWCGNAVYNQATSFCLVPNTPAVVGECKKTGGGALPCANNCFCIGVQVGQTWYCVCRVDT